MHILLNKGFCVTANSSELADIFASHKLETYRTVRLNRKEMPAEWKKIKIEERRHIRFSERKSSIHKEEVQERCDASHNNP